VLSPDGQQSALATCGAQLLPNNIGPMSGPLSGYTIIELAGIGPGPFAGMLLADMGADVIRVERAQAVPAPGSPSRPNVMIAERGRRSIGVDLKQAEGRETVLKLVEKADALFEGFRPGVTERLGLGPDDCLARNPKLVYGRMTGWGQEGPYANAAGHDINYIALAGALEGIGRAGERPVPPLNLVGDFGGGGMFLAFGVVCALLEAQRSGKGQVVDAAMVDGAATLMAMFHSFKAMGMLKPERGTNLLDTGAHFYDVYTCSDGKHVSIGSIEPQFYAELRRLAGLDDDAVWGPQMDQSRWPELKVRIAEVFATKTRDEWCALMEHTDVCFAPVLSMDEAPHHPHNVARSTFVTRDGLTQPAPAPRFSRTAAELPAAAPRVGEHTDEVLQWAGLADADIAALRSCGAVR
jgi:alpha-methylacyl-CoA racemase